MPLVTQKPQIQPHWTTADGNAVKLYQGDVLEVLRKLPSKSVHCCITSPPYWGLRSYATAKWEGGDPNCDHTNGFCRGDTAEEGKKGDRCGAGSPAPRYYKELCEKCGAKSSDLQLGSETSPDRLCWARGENCAAKDWASGCHVCRMRLVFREVHRVLRDDGTLWLNYGDTYFSGGVCGGSSPVGDRAYRESDKERQQKMTVGKRESRTVDTVSDAVKGYDGVFQRRVGRQSADGQFQVQVETGLSAGNLIGVPWRVALALQADGWILRSDIPWVKRCLSAQTYVYARTQKGDMPTTIKDLVRLRPDTVQLWDGKKWNQVIGFCKTIPSQSLEIELRSGEKIITTADHIWPVEGHCRSFQAGLFEDPERHEEGIRADGIRVGHRLKRVRLPEPEGVITPSALDDEEIGWFVGLYLAEGCLSGERVIVLAGHKKETEDRINRLRPIVEAYHGTVYSSDREGQGESVCVSGPILIAILQTYLHGDTCKNKSLTNKCWMRSDKFLLSLLKGYLEGDGHWDSPNQRWRLGFTGQNDLLARDLRTICARLGVSIRLRRGLATAVKGGEKFKVWKGEIRMSPPVGREDIGRGFKILSDNEVVAIRQHQAGTFWDIEVAEDPHLFCLATGILTHNSAMPSSVRNRPSGSLEYVFLLTKVASGYYYDMEAIRREPGKPWNSASFIPDAPKDSGDLTKRTAGGGASRSNRSTDPVTNGRAFRNADLWFESVDSPHGLTGVGDETGEELVGIDVTSESYKGSHYATFPSRLIIPFILAGTSETGCCVKCGSPWQRVVSEATGGSKGQSWHPHNADEETGNDKVVSSNGYKTGSTLYWEPSCRCTGEDGQPADRKPCITLDPFAGSGTVAATSVRYGRYSWGIELSQKYLDENAIPRINDALRSIPSQHDKIVERELKVPDVKAVKIMKRKKV